MIDQHTARSRECRRLWAGHVERLFDTLELSERRGAADISQSLAAFCEQQPRMSQQALSLLAARSFCAAGDRDAAVRVLRHDRTHRSCADSWLDVLSDEYPFPGLYPLFNARALRPLRLASAGGQAVWVLDLNRIGLPESARHEIILFRTLRVLTEKISNVWKQTGGEGTLLVKGSSRLPCASSETAGYIRDVLHRCAERNGWAGSPSVLLFDL